MMYVQYVLWPKFTRAVLLLGIMVKSRLCFSSSGAGVGPEILHF